MTYRGTVRRVEDTGARMSMQVEWLRAYVEKLLREEWDEEPWVDDDGDIPFRSGTAACWVRVHGSRRAMRVEVFAQVVQGVKPTAQLLRELNECNALMVYGWIYETNGSVVVEQSIDVDGLNGRTLRRACNAVGAVADDMGSLLAAMFDGTTPYPPEAVAFEPPGVEAEGV